MFNQLHYYKNHENFKFDLLYFSVHVLVDGFWKHVGIFDHFHSNLQIKINYSLFINSLSLQNKNAHIFCKSTKLCPIRIENQLFVDYALENILGNFKFIIYKEFLFFQKICVIIPLCIR